MRIKISTEVQAPLSKVVSNFESDLFKALSPPLIGVDLIRFDGSEKGDQVHVDLKMLGTTQRWEALIVENESTDDRWYFKDVGQILPFPFKNWQHKHFVNKISNEAVEIIDDVNYNCSNMLVDILVYPFVYFQFFWRKHIYKSYFLNK